MRKMKVLIAASTIVVWGSAAALAADDEYVVGGNGDMSGPLAYLGVGLSTGSRAYFDALNAKGGINGHKIRYLPLDHRSDTAAGIANVKSLVQGSKALAILGYDSSVIVDAALAEMERDKVVGLIQGATPASMKGAWTFNSAAYIAGEALPLIAMAGQQIANPKPRVAIMTQASPVLVALTNDLVKQLAAKEWPLVANQSAALSSTDVSAQVSAVARENPDVVFSLMSGPKIQLVVSGLRKIGYEGPIIGHTPEADVVSLKGANDPKFIVMREMAFADDQGPTVKTMDEDIRRTGADPDTAWIINGYIQAMIISEGLSRCGWPCSSEKLRTSLESAPITSLKEIVFGPISYTATDHKGISKVQYYRWDGQKPAKVGDSIDY